MYNDELKEQEGEKRQGRKGNEGGGGGGGRGGGGGGGGGDKVRREESGTCCHSCKRNFLRVCSFAQVSSCVPPFAKTIAMNSNRHSIVKRGCMYDIPIRELAVRGRIVP